VAQSHRIDAIDRYFNQTKIRYLGLGVMLAWVYCTWFSDGIFDASQRAVAVQTLNYSLVGSVVVLFAIAFRKNKRTPFSMKAIFLCAMGLSATTLLFFVVPAGPALYAVAFLGGLSGGMLWVAWGELFCQIDAETMESAIPASLIAFIIAASTVYLMPAPVSGIFSALLPVISCIMLLLCKNNEPADFAFPARKMPFAKVLPALFGLAVCSMVCSIATGFVVATATPALEMLQGSGFILVYVLGAFVAVCISVFALAHTRHVNLSFLYEWAIPLIVFSLSFNALDYPHCGDVALILGCAAALYVEVLFYVIFSRIAANGLCLPSETFGIFRGVVQLGFLMGTMLSSVVSMREGAVLPTSLLMICLCVVMLPLFMHLQNRFDISASGKEPDEARSLPPCKNASPALTLKASGETSDCGDESDARPEPDGLPQQRCAVAQMALDYKLSKRETEVLGYLSKGRSVPYMREAMVLSKSTIETHVKHIYAKCDVHSKQELLDLIERYEQPETTPAP